MVADMMSDPSEKKITVSLTVSMLILCIFRIETFSGYGKIGRKRRALCAIS